MEQFHSDVFVWVKLLDVFSQYWGTMWSEIQLPSCKKKNNKKNHLDFKFCSSGGEGGGQSNAVGFGRWVTDNSEDEKYKLVT